MTAQILMILLQARKRKSAMDNDYFLLDLQEPLPYQEEDGSNATRPWFNVYYSPSSDINDFNFIEGNEYLVELNFYPKVRKHNGNTYTDIKTHVVSIVEVKDN